MIIKRKERTCMSIFPWSTSTWKLLQKFSIIQPEETCSTKKTILTIFQFIGLLLQGIQKSAFTGSYTENPFYYQRFNLKQTKVLRGGQRIVDFDAVKNCFEYVTTMKAMNFQDINASIPTIDNFGNFQVLVFEIS